MAAYAHIMRTTLAPHDAIAELPFTSVRVGRVLSGAGAGSCSLDLSDPHVLAADALAATVPRRSMLWIDRDGVPFWSGIVWRRRYNSATRKLELQLAEPWSHFGYQFITSDLAPTGQSAADILLSTVALTDVAPRNVLDAVDLVDDGPDLTGFTVAASERRNVRDLGEQLSRVSPGGFDFYVQPQYDDTGAPVLTLVVRAPLAGRTSAETGYVLEHGENTRGNVVEYVSDQDGDREATDVLGIGAGEGADGLIAIVSDPSQADNLMPTKTEVLAFKEVREQAILTALVVSALDVRRSIDVLSVRLLADADPRLGAWALGDNARLRITDDYYPALSDGQPSFDEFKRIIGWDLSIPDDGAPEVVDLVLGGSI